MAKVVMYHVTGVWDRVPFEALIVNPKESDMRGYIANYSDVMHLEVHKLEFEADWPLMPGDTVFVKE